MSIKCSVCILTYNSEKTINRCLESVKDFSDIVILDGGSTDKTREISVRFSARVFNQRDDGLSAEIVNFSDVRKKLFELAKEQWILWLDSDEWLSVEARERIADIICNDRGGVLYAFLRKAVIYQTIVEHAYFYPEYCKRLFKKSDDIDFKKGKAVHEDLIAGAGVDTKRIGAVIFHSWHESLEALRKKDEYYLSLSVMGKEGWSTTKKVYIFMVNIAKAAYVLYRSCGVYLRYGYASSLPATYVWRFVVYHLKYARKIIFLK